MGGSTQTSSGGDTFWQEQTGVYTALTNSNNTPLFYDYGLNSATPYSIGGGLNPAANFVQDNGSGGGALNIMGVSSHGDGGFLNLGSLLFFNRSRGSSAVPTALQAGDDIGGMVFGGYGSGDYQLALSGMIGTAIDDWDISPGAMDLKWVVAATNIFFTSSTNNKTTAYYQWQYDSQVGINSVPSADNPLRVVTPTTAASYAEALFSTSASARTPVVVQGWSAQSANLTEWQNDSGTVLASILADGNLTVPDEAYGVGWNGSLEVPTKNAIYDKIETISASNNPQILNTTIANTTITAGYSSYISDFLEIGSGFTYEVGSNARLEIG
jgi:hypothetical protein